jgi:drug/metabolite transporter (DMT)-like permease
MSFKHFAMLIGIVSGISIGQILFKKTANNLNSMNSVYAMFFDPWFWSGLTVYGICTILWISILRFVPLSISYSIFALSFVIVPTLAFFLLKEPITWRIYVGGILILSGILFITRN